MADPISINSILSQTPTTQEVYSANNIQQASTTPAAPPDLSDPMGLYSYYMNTPELKAAQQQYQAGYQNLLSAKNLDRAQQEALQQNPESINLIRGRQAEANRMSSLNLNALADALGVSQANLASLTQTAQERMNVAMSQRGELVNLMTQYPGAKISFTDTIDSAAKKIKKYEDKVAKEQKKAAEKLAVRDAYMQAFGSRGGKLSKREMESKLEKFYGSKNAMDMALAQKSLRSGGGGSSKEAKEAQYISDVEDIGANFRGSAGSDGYVNPKDYLKQKSGFLKYNPGKSTEFDALFAGYRNPDDDYLVD